MEQTYKLEFGGKLYNSINCSGTGGSSFLFQKCNNGLRIHCVSMKWPHAGITAADVHLQRILLLPLLLLLLLDFNYDNIKTANFQTHETV